MRTGLTAAVVAASLGVLLSAVPAGAAQSQVIIDCNAHGKLTRTYSVGQLRNALATMPADVKEYTGCYDVIQQALLTTLSGAKGSGAGGSGGSGASTFPTWLIVVLVLLGLAGVTLGAVALRRRGART